MYYLTATIMKASAKIPEWFLLAVCAGQGLSMSTDTPIILESSDLLFVLHLNLTLTGLNICRYFPTTSH